MTEKILAIIKNKKLQKEFFRFIICGVISTVIDFVVFALVIYVFDPRAFNYNIISSLFADSSLVSTVSVIAGTAAGFLTALIANYLISVFFVFEDTGKGKTHKGRMLFFIFSAAGFFLNLLLMYIMFDVLNINQWISKVIVTGIVLIFNFVTRKLFIFNSKENETAIHD